MSGSPAKHALFVPALRGNLAESPNLRDSLEAEGVTVHGIDLVWENTGLTIPDHIEAMRQQANALALPPDTILIGHSIGAIIGPMEARQQGRKYGRLILASVAAAGQFRRELNASDLGRRLGSNDYQSVRDLAGLDPRDIFTKLQVPASERRVFIAEHEPGGQFMVNQADQAATLLGAREVVTVPDAGHLIKDFPTYVAAITQAVVAPAA